MKTTITSKIETNIMNNDNKNNIHDDNLMKKLNDINKDIVIDNKKLKISRFLSLQNTTNFNGNHNSNDNKTKNIPKKRTSMFGLSTPGQIIRPPTRPDPTQGIWPDASRIARQEKRNVRAELIKKLKKVSKVLDPDQRNPVVKEIVEDYLKKSIKVFEARWTEGTPLTDEVFVATPLFWYKRHKWQAKDIKELFDIAGINRPTLDSELNLLYDLDGSEQNGKKSKKKHVFVKNQ